MGLVLLRAIFATDWPPPASHSRARAHCTAAISLGLGSSSPFHCSRLQREMFCPLCKAEFRDGFTQCSDCHLPLVATKQEADQQLVTPVWRGGSPEFESVLTALQDAKIPLLFRERLNARRAVQASVLPSLASLRRPTPVFDTEFEIKV